MPPVIALALYAAAALLTSLGLFEIKQHLSALPPGALSALRIGDLLGFILPLAIYLSGMGSWLAAMVRNPLSTAYPIGIGLSLVTATGVAIVALGEPVGLGKILGVCAILAGAALIGRSSHD
jgi:multidrug transporter EmrE-like cation transporter